MATQFANGKTTTSGLVFMYDTTDKENCYKGEPTTNLATDSPSDVGGWGGYYLLVDSATKSFNLRVNDGGAGSAWKSFYWNVSSYIGQYITITANYTFGTEYNCNFQHITVGQGNTGPYPIHIAGSDEVDRLTISSKTSQQITWSGVINATGIVGFTVWLADASAGAYTICNVSNVQIEAKSHKTPFINGTRSATQGLKDLMVTNQIDISTVSFDSNAQIIFDGTDDTLDTGIALTELPALSNFSLECIVKIDSYPTAASPNGYGNTTKCGVLLGATYYCGTALYWYGNASGNACTIYAYIRGNDGYRTAGEYNLIPGQYHHLVLVNDYTNSAINLYANGVLNGTYSGPTQQYNPGLTPYAGNIGISKAQVDGGGEAVYSYFNGQIPVVKIYKKALTASEVTQNYRAIKTRFNLA